MEQKYSEIIKQKADFIMNNSGILIRKIENETTKDETINGLIIILLSDLSIEHSELNNIAKDLISQSIMHHNDYDNNYQNAIKVIFILCFNINKLIKNDSQRRNLLDIIRKYPQKFKCSKREQLEVNQKYVKYNEESYQKIKYNKRTK